MLALVASNDSESGIRDFLCAACFAFKMIPPTTKEIPLGLAEMQGWFEPSGKQAKPGKFTVCDTVGPA